MCQICAYFPIAQGKSLDRESVHQLLSYLRLHGGADGTTLCKQQQPIYIKKNITTSELVTAFVETTVPIIGYFRAAFSGSERTTELQPFPLGKTDEQFLYTIGAATCLQELFYCIANHFQQEVFGRYCFTHALSEICKELPPETAKRVCMKLRCHPKKFLQIYVTPAESHFLLQGEYQLTVAKLPDSGYIIASDLPEAWKTRFEYTVLNHPLRIQTPKAFKKLFEKKKKPNYDTQITDDVCIQRK